MLTRATFLPAFVHSTLVDVRLSNNRAAGITSSSGGGAGRVFGRAKKPRPKMSCKTHVFLLVNDVLPPSVSLLGQLVAYVFFTLFAMGCQQVCLISLGFLLG